MGNLGWYKTRHLRCCSLRRWEGFTWSIMNTICMSYPVVCPFLSTYYAWQAHLAAWKVTLCTASFQTFSIFWRTILPLNSIQPLGHWANGSLLRFGLIFKGNGPPINKKHIDRFRKVHTCCWGSPHNSRPPRMQWTLLSIRRRRHHPGQVTAATYHGRMWNTLQTS